MNTSLMQKEGCLQALIEFLCQKNGWLNEKICGYTEDQKHFRGKTGPLQDWRQFIPAFTESLHALMSPDDWDLKPLPENPYKIDPVIAFGAEQAEKNRSQWSGLSRFFSLLRQYREAYLELIRQNGFSPENVDFYRGFIERFIDELEIGYCLEYCSPARQHGNGGGWNPIAEQSVDSNEYFLAFQGVGEPVILLDKENRVKSLNHAALALFESAAMAAPSSAIQKEERDPLSRLLKELLVVSAAEDECRIEKKIHSEGEKRHFSINIRRLFDSCRCSQGSIITLHDVTPQKKIEQALRESQKMLFSINQLLPVGVCLIDENGHYVIVNEAYCRITGFQKEELIGQHFGKVGAPDTAQQEKEEFESLIQGGSDTVIERKRKRKDGLIITVQAAHALLKLENGRRLLIATVIDMSERICMENALRESEERLNLAVANTGLGLWDLRVPSGEVMRSPQWAAMLGYTPEEINGNLAAWECLIHPDDVGKAKNALAVHLSGQVDNFMAEYRMRTKSGEWKWILDRGQAVAFDDHGKPVRLIGTHEDITAHKQAEQALSTSEEKFSKAFQISPDGISLCRASDGYFLEINEGVTRQLGYTREDVKGKTVSELRFFSNPQEHLRFKKEIMEHGEVQGFESEFRKKDGTIVYGSLAGKTLVINGEECLLVISRDISEQRKLEGQLRQAVKMDAIGQLAGGIAHDFNNLLTGILGYANLLQMEAKPGTVVADAAKTIEKAAERAAELTGQLLGFARRGKHQEIPVDVHETIHNVIRLLSHTVDKNVSIIQRQHARQAIILGDPNQMEQMLLNLAINARDAMPNGGELVFETDIEELTENDCRSQVEMSPGRYLVIKVIDNGCGIPPENMEHLFEPFFTTKEQGKGTGMGLAMVYGIVKNHDGSIQVDSESGAGTTFKVCLPLADGVITFDEPIEMNIVNGKGCILLVDDEAIVRQTVPGMLLTLGYDILTAADGNEALEIYRTRGDMIDLVILDMIMPGMGGQQCYRELKKMNPSIKAILSTGYSLDGKVQDILDEGMLGFIQKPFKINELSVIVKDSLSGMVSQKDPALEAFTAGYDAKLHNPLGGRGMA